MKKSKLIPALRFPEFVNEGEWEKKRVEEYFNVGSSKRVLQQEWTSNGVPFYRTRELVSLSKNEPFSSEIFISESLYSELLDNYGVPSEGDFLVSGVGTLGISYQVKEGDKFYFKDGNVIWFKLLGELNSTFFKYCFESEYLQGQINAQTAKSTVGTYTIQNAKKTEFWYPPNLHEQQKIASCLSSLDEVISAHSQKLKLLQAHKKGLIQNLFPQEGEKVPKWRFKEFQTDGDWELTALNKISEAVFDGTHQTPNYTESGIPFFSVENIVSGSKNKFISREDYLNETRNNKPEYGDVLITRIGSIGISKVVDWDYEFSVYVTLAVVKKSEKFDSQFLSSYMQSNRFQKEIRGRSLLNAVPQKINMNELRECEVLLPPKFKEQQKIASCLSSLNTLIIALSEKVEQLQQHKKGLMQGLFPKNND